MDLGTINNGDPTSSRITINLLIQQIEDVIKFDKRQLLESQLSRLKSLSLDISILECQLSRLKSLLLDTSNQFQENTLMASETMNNRLRRIQDEVGKGKQLIDHSKWAQQRCFDSLLCRSRPKLSGQIREWKTSFNDLFRDLQTDFSLFNTAPFIVSSAQQKGKVLLQEKEEPDANGLLPTGIKHDEVVIERWLREAPLVRIIGVCGSAGVGKTRLLQNVYNSYKVSDFFDVVLWVTVGQSGILKLQDCIARAVNLDLGAQHSIDLHMRKIKLSEYFRAKKFLVIFDDISVPLNLKELGVEFGDDKGSKVICSSRTKDVIESKVILSSRSSKIMGAKHFIYIQPLTPEEAWELFCNLAFKDGHLPHHLPLHIARKVADECRGVPLAIHVLAATLRGNTSVNEWNLAFTQMQDHKFPTSYLSTDDHLYPILRWSYERLPDANFKSCFLYCAMFPGDEEIEVEKMLGMWIAEGIVKSMDSAHSYLKLLVDRCFFKVTHIPHGKVFVKTYHPLRDVATYFGMREERCLFEAGKQVTYFGGIVKNDWKRISFYGNKIKYIPAKGLKYRNLVSLILGANKELEEVSMSFLEQLPSIRVLDLSGTNIKLLPITLWSRIRLEYLDLSYTQIEYLSESIGYLSQLQFLNLSGCSNLNSLPEAIGHLSKLQFLNLSGCSKLTSIPSVVYELKSLKYLHISQYNVLI